MNKQSTPALVRTSCGITMLATALLTVSCKEIPKEVEITEQRELCKFDENEALRGAVNRFWAKQPLHWRRVPETENRQLNYRVGDDIQVALGTFKGSVEANAIRWFGQFGQKIDSIDLSTLRQGTMLGGAPYYVVEIRGSFETSMGGPPVNLKGWSTIGIICKAGNNELITIKMTGPEKETAKELPNLIQYAENLKFITFPEDNLK